METTSLRSHGDAAVELLDLLFEEFFKLRPLSFQRRGQEAVLDGKHLGVDVDVLHLQIKTPADKLDLVSITLHYFKKPCDWLIVAVFRFFYCDNQSWTYLLKGVQATGFTQTYQIFQDGILHLLWRKGGCSNCSPHPIIVSACRRSSCAPSTYHVCAELLVGTQQTSFPGPVRHHLWVWNHDSHQT